MASDEQQLLQLSGGGPFGVQFSYAFPPLNDQPIDFATIGGATPAPVTVTNPIQDYEIAAGELAAGAGTAADSVQVPDRLQIIKDVYAPAVLETSAAFAGQPILEQHPMDFMSSISPYQPSTDLSSFFNSAANDLVNFLQEGAINTSAGGGVRLIPQFSITKNAYACERGKHVAKAKKGASVGKCVSNRHMNPLNPKALGRAVRRLSGFQHFAIKTEKAIQASFRKAGIHGAKRTTAGRCNTCRRSKCNCG
jgi:hypothetical protein